MHETMLDQELRDFKDSARKWIEKEVSPFHEKWEHDGITPKDIYKNAGSQGLLCITQAEEFGGLGLDYRFASILTEEMGYAMASGLALFLHSDIVVPYLEHYGSQEQKMRWLPGCTSGEIISAIAMTEPGTGSDLQNIQTKAERQGDDWIINGSKTFISNGINANLIVVCARTEKKSAGQKFTPLSLFVVEEGMPGFERGRNLDKIGMKAQDTAELFFHNCRVPAKNLLGEDGQGFIYLNNELAQERLAVAGFCLGYAKRCLDETIGYVKQRQAFGKNISEFQNTRFKLAHIATQIEAAECMLDYHISLHIQKKCTAAQASMSKLFVTEVFGQTADECLQLFGGHGYMSEFPISKAFVDARVQRIFAGTNEIMKEIIARQLLR